MSRGRKCIALSPPYGTEICASSDQSLNDLSMSIMPVEIVEKILSEAAILNASNVFNNNLEVYRSMALVCRQWRLVIAGDHFQRAFQQCIPLEFPCRKYVKSRQIEIVNFDVGDIQAFATIDDELYARAWDGQLDVYTVNSTTTASGQVHQATLRHLRTLHLFPDIVDDYPDLISWNQKLYLFDAEQMRLFEVNRASGQAIVERQLNTPEHIWNGVERTHFIADDLSVYRRTGTDGLVRSTKEDLLEVMPWLPADTSERELIAFLLMELDGRTVVRDEDGCILYLERDKKQLLVYDHRLRPTVILKCLMIAGCGDVYYYPYRETAALRRLGPFGLFYRDFMWQRKSASLFMWLSRWKK